MSDAARKKRFQIHLSTAVVMMFVAGVLIWANTRDKAEVEVENVRSGEVFLVTSVGGGSNGWPFVAVRYRYSMDYRPGPLMEILEGMPPVPGVTSEIAKERYRVIYLMAAINLAIALSVLFAVWFLCEWLIRRCAARKGA